MAQIPVNAIQRNQLENIVLRQQSLLKDLIKLVRARSKPDWRLRQEFEARLAQFGEFNEGFREVYLEEKAAQVAAEKHRKYWGGVEAKVAADQR